MIEEWFRIICNGCEIPNEYKPVPGDDSSRPAGTALLAAEKNGWKVYRTCFDIHYGKAWCPACRDDRCPRCWLGVIPDFKNKNAYGEPSPVPCPNCEGRGWL